MSLNKVMLIGNVGKKPEVRYLESSPQNASQAPKVATFPLATSERFTDRSGNRQERTEWHNIVAWRGNADLAEKFIDKGSQIYVEGRISTRQWTDQTGARRFTTEIIADTIQLLGRRPDQQDGQPASQYQAAPQPASQYQPAPQPAPAPQAPVQDSEPTDDLPF